MRLKFLATIALVTLLISGCEETTGETAVTTDSSGVQTFTAHHQGDNCFRCHSGSNAPSLREDDETNFNTATTIFTKIDAATVNEESGQVKRAAYLTSDYTLRLVLENTNTTINFSKTNGSANMAATLNTGSINSFTVQVVDAQGKVVNSSNKNTHDLTRLECNRCHTSSGTNGAPGRVVNFSLSAPTTDTPAPTTTTTRSFSNDVMPILNQKCKACHGSNGRFSLSDAAGSYSNINAFSGINTSTPDNSRLLSKMRGVSHGGGSVIGESSSEYQSIKEWITQGALNN